MSQAIFFYGFAASAVLAALCVVMPPLPKARAPIHSAIALIVCFFFLAAVFVLLQAHLLAALQIMVYAGAIMVLFIFVIMLLNLQPGRQRVRPPPAFKVVAALLALWTGGILVAGFLADDLLPAGLAAELDGVLPNPDTFGTIKPIGALLFGKYLLPFELISILILVAIIGAVVVAKRDPRTTFQPEVVRAATARERHGGEP